MLDLIIVLGYFMVIFMVAIKGRVSQDAGVEEYFLSSRNLKWPSIAISTIATNIQGYQFLGMMGSAYLYGLAQASLEINAVQGILMAAFIFVPLYLRDRVVTVTQFIQKRLGRTIGLCYSLANLFLFSTITLGAALFWGAYAADLVFGDMLSILSENRMIRISILIATLGVFSASYTYLGGLGAVVKTDVIQFVVLLLGGIIVLFTIMKALGGWDQLYVQTPEKMHLYLPADHPKLPWIHMFGLFFLNINYWCANQSVMQRSLAAKSLRHAQLGLMAGGVMKYVMAVLIVIPGIALYGLLGKEGLAEPDMAFPYIVNNFLPTGLKGVILCALFASLMSTIDSTYNSLATLWSVDIYKGYLKKDASEVEMVRAGKRTILVSLCTGVVMGLILMYVKFEDSGAAFTHTLNEMRYYVNTGIVVLICTAALMMTPNRKAVFFAFVATVPLHFIIQLSFPEMNYFVRAMWVIIIALVAAVGMSAEGGFRKNIFKSYDRRTSVMGVVLLLSLVLLHLVFV